MSVRFDLQGRLVVIRARLWGPSASGVVKMALDTGATSTLLSVSALVALGYDPTTATEHSEVATGSCLETVPFIVLQRIRALEQERTNLPVLCHTLPVEVGIDGLLGLDFLHDRRLVIDFRLGEIMLT